MVESSLASVVHQEVEHENTFEVQDTNNETARSMYQVLQLIAFHELKGSAFCSSSLCGSQELMRRRLFREQTAEFQYRTLRRV